MLIVINFNVIPGVWEQEPKSTADLLFGAYRNMITTKFVLIWHKISLIFT